MQHVQISQNFKVISISYGPNNLKQLKYKKILLNYLKQLKYILKFTVNTIT